jgi:tetratricopeptide (TPR) repeat protein
VIAIATEVGEYPLHDREKNMGEGLLEGLIGGEEEQTDSTEGGTEPIVAAIAANVANQNPEVAFETAAMFRKQTEVLEIQKKNLEAEYEFFEAEWKPRLLALHLRTGFQVLLALFALVIGLALALVIWSGTRSHSVVIDPFEVPTPLAADGLNGKVVASGLLDVLTNIQAASRTNIEHRNLSNAWTNEISIDVPETGLSLSQLERMVETRFGHDQHIDGDLIRTGPGILALTVRGNGILPKTFSGDAGDLDQLLTRAGEYLFSQSLPGLWTAYLANNNRDEEAIAFAQAVYNSVAASERPYVLNYWANAITDKGDERATAKALPLYREAVRLKPDYWNAYNDIMFALAGLGDEEGALQTGRQMIKLAGGRPGRASEEMFQNYDEIVLDLPAERASNIADMESHGGIGTSSAIVGAENLNIAQLDIWMHDSAAATLRLQTTPIDDKNFADVAEATLDRALLAEEVGDLKKASKEWDDYAADYANPRVSTPNPQWICYAAVTFEKTGQAAKADAALKPFGGVTMVDCYRFKGDVLDLRGDWSGAQEWYGKAVTLGPSLPAGYYSWGLALAKHGDLIGATEKFKLANERGPHWADPLKAWGDVLMQRNAPREALRKYDEALKYAPNWKQLKDSREEAANQSH